MCLSIPMISSRVLIFVFSESKGEPKGKDASVAKSEKPAKERDKSPPALPPSFSIAHFLQESFGRPEKTSPSKKEKETAEKPPALRKEREASPRDEPPKREEQPPALVQEPRSRGKSEEPRSRGKSEPPVEKVPLLPTPVLGTPPSPKAPAARAPLLPSPVKTPPGNVTQNKGEAVTLGPDAKANEHPLTGTAPLFGIPIPPEKYSGLTQAKADAADIIRGK